jgi:CDP-diacylglycerol---glycerol-3-phosphate 3-phosphatidyltransferase
VIRFVPNGLTILRIILTPVFLFLAVQSHNQTALIWAWVVFVTCALTDWLDGLIARRHDIITNFGKIWDPLADKFIVLAALGVLTWIAPFQLPLPIFIVIALREILVTILREVYSRQGIIIPADRWGKLKTILQMVGIVVCLGCWAVGFMPAVLITVSLIWFWVVALVTLLSGINYLRIKR